ncbi:MAG TPA: multidrug ABC transporter [Ruminococcus sp.]|nr:multidrug ABC transporter [Ruminococcus sp.]
MTKLMQYALLMVLSSLISSFSQIMLKKAAGRQYENKLREYLNPTVITAYGIFFGCTLLSMYALKVVPLSMSPILESTGYIFVAVLSYLFFREIPTKRQFLGFALIFAGILVYAM